MPQTVSRPPSNRLMMPSYIIFASRLPIPLAQWRLKSGDSFTSRAVAHSVMIKTSLMIPGSVKARVKGAN